MYKFLVPVVIFFSLTLSSHAMFGKGEIEIDTDFKEGYQGYLQALKENKKMTGAFAADSNGSWGWSLASGPNSLGSARKGAIENCNESSTSKSCRLFARNNKIFWKWNGLPDMSFDDSKFVNANEINVSVGNGNVYLSYYTKQAFNDYKSFCKANEKKYPDSNVYCYFAISSNGTKSGSAWMSQTKAGKGKSIVNEVKASAVADCMEQNNKKQCYLYAMNDKVIWENSQPANTSSTPVESTASVESIPSSSSTKEKLLELKTLLNDGLISQDEHDKKRAEILESF